MVQIKPEYIYFLLPFAGLSRQIGGTFWKAWDRFFFPMIITAVLFLFMGWSWWLLPTLGAYIASRTLPLTLIGDSIRKPLINRFWVFLVGYIQALPCLFLFLDQWESILLLCLIPMFIYGVAINLSNVDKTSRLFTWKFVEFITGASYLYPLCYMLGG